MKVGLVICLMFLFRCSHVTERIVDVNEEHIEYFHNALPISNDEIYLA